MSTYASQENGDGGVPPPVPSVSEEAAAAVLQRMFNRSVSTPVALQTSRQSDAVGISVAGPTPLAFGAGTGAIRTMPLEQQQPSMLEMLAAPMTSASVLVELSRQVDNVSIAQPGVPVDFGELPAPAPASPVSMQSDARRERHSWTSDGTPVMDARRMRGIVHAPATRNKRPSSTELRRPDPVRSTYNGSEYDQNVHDAVHESDGLIDSFNLSYERLYGHITPLDDVRRLPSPHSPALRAHADSRRYDSNGPKSGSPLSALEDPRRLGASAAASPVEPTVVLTTASASIGSPSPLEDPRRLPDYEQGLAVGTSPTHTHTGVGAGSVVHPLGRPQPAVVVPGSPAISSGTTTPSPLEDPRRIAPASSSFSSSYATGSCAPSASSISTSCTSSPSPGQDASPLYHVRTQPSLSEPSSTTSSPMEDARRLRHCNRLSGVGDGAAQAQAHQHTSAFPVVAADVLGSGTLLDPRFPRPFNGGFVNADFSERLSGTAGCGQADRYAARGPAPVTRRCSRTGQHDPPVHCGLDRLGAFRTLRTLRLSDSGHISGEPMVFRALGGSAAPRIEGGVESGAVGVRAGPRPVERH